MALSLSEMAAKVSKPAYKLTMIILLLAIELYATPNGNLTNEVYRVQKSGFLNVVQSSTVSRPLTFHYSHLYNRKNFTQSCYRNMAQLLSYYLNINLN